MGDSYQKIMTRAPSVPEDTMLFEKEGFYLCLCLCLSFSHQKKLGNSHPARMSAPSVQGGAHQGDREARDEREHKEENFGFF